MNKVAKQRAIRNLFKVCTDEKVFGTGFLCTAENLMSIVTASHCIPRLIDPNLIGGDPLLVTVHPMDSPKDRIELLVRFVDPCSDVAILGDENWQLDLCELEVIGPKYQEAFLKFFEIRGGLEIRVEELPTDEPCPVYVHTIDGRWLSGKVQHSDPWSPFLGIDFKGSPKPGTSGSPVFDEAGRAVGIVVSSAMQKDRHSVVSLAGALPGWAINRIEAGRNPQPIPPEIARSVKSLTAQKATTTRKKVTSKTRR